MPFFPVPTTTHLFLSAFGEIWYLWSPLLLLLLGVGWATRRWWGGKVTLVSLFLLFCFVAKTVVRDRAIERNAARKWNARRVPLPQAEKIDGLQMKAGTMVRWASEKEHRLLTAELGDGQEVSPGIVLTGEVDRVWDDAWRGKLARPSVIRGWHCAAGKVDLYTSGELRWCLLESQQKTRAGSVPAGTAILLQALNGPGDALLHLGHTGMRVTPGDFWIAPDQWFSLYADGQLGSIPGPISLRGVAFDDGVVLRYGEEDATPWYGDSDAAPSVEAPPSAPVTGWRGDLAAPLTCENGRTIDKGNRITIPVSGDVVTTLHWDFSGPHAKQVLDFAHCRLEPSR